MTVIVLTAGIFMFHSYSEPVFAPEEPEGIRVPILMYHSVLRDPKAEGAYIVSPNTMESDFYYLLTNGYTPVFVSDLAKYVYGNTPLPEKPVVITLDDGYLNNFTYVFPLLQKYDFKAVISVIGISSEKFSKAPDPSPSYAHLTWNDIAVMAQSGHVEIANHSYALHYDSRRHGCMKMWGESSYDFETCISKDILKTQELLLQYCGVTPTTFAYPFGTATEETDK
ncbi:MAG: polysaccharide deacetylase family protein, partial [Clostridiales bacterium]|nr:polysaccharide deacetylase family protein [Clostridiales bacterium]